MVLSQEESAEIKKQILEQLEKTDVDNKEQIKEHISNLNEEQLEEFIKNNDIRLEKENEKPIFQLIVEKKIPSYNIGENEKAIAILEINPLSKGHCIVIPKEKTSIEKIQKSCFSLIKKITKKINSELKPKDVKMENFSVQGYPAINIVPIYDKPLKKEKASEEVLKELQLKLSSEKKERNRILKPKLSKSKDIPIISFRVP